MSDIIREVDEELRREDWENVSEKYGKFVIAGALGIVLATAAVVGWQWRPVTGNLIEFTFCQRLHFVSPVDVLRFVPQYS